MYSIMVRIAIFRLCEYVRIMLFRKKHHQYEQHLMENQAAKEGKFPVALPVACN